MSRHEDYMKILMEKEAEQVRKATAAT